MRDYETTLYSLSAAKEVRAVVRCGLTAEDLAEAELEWQPVRNEIVQQLLGKGMSDEEIPVHFQNSHWNWIRKAGYLQWLAYAPFGIECSGKIQG